MFQGTEQFIIVPLMKADRRFIENIQDADQAGANLRSEADTLRFPTRQSACSPGQGQVFQSYGPQEIETGPDFLENLLSSNVSKKWIISVTDKSVS